MNHTPVGDKVLIELDVHKEVNELGLAMPKRKVLTGTVLDVGHGTKDYQMKLKAGDRVRFHDNAGTHVRHNDKGCLIISEFQCIAIL